MALWRKVEHGFFGKGALAEGLCRRLRALLTFSKIATPSRLRSYNSAPVPLWGIIVNLRYFRGSYRPLHKQGLRSPFRCPLHSRLRRAPHLEVAPRVSLGAVAEGDLTGIPVKSLDITTNMKYYYGYRGCSSAGEHLVRNEGATGSIPVTSTINF